MRQEWRWLEVPSGGPSRQRGAAAIEFGLLFLLFFAVFYALVSYALPMLMMQAFHHAAMAGARAAVKVDLDTTNYEETVGETVRSTVGARLAWLPAQAKTVVLGAGNDNMVRVEGGIVTVTVSYDNYAANPLMPILTLPGIGPVPRLPADLTAVASLEL
ncbi:MAG: TadE/TadG family type IV pilus assembly protein [Gammaproteobacteria bacterium]